MRSEDIERFRASQHWHIDPGIFAASDEEVTVWANPATFTSLAKVKQALGIQEIVDQIRGKGFERDNVDQWQKFANLTKRTITTARWKEGQMLRTRDHRPQAA